MIDKKQAIKAQQIRSELCHFTGTEHYYTHWLKALVYTDGVKFLANTCDAYWLIDLVASYRRKEPFQIWELVVSPDNKAVATMQTSEHSKPKVTQEIGYTDFPLETVTLWLIDGVLLLPSEY